MSALKIRVAMKLKAKGILAPTSEQITEAFQAVIADYNEKELADGVLKIVK